MNISILDGANQTMNNTFAIFGADRAVDNSCMLTAMDLLCAQPGRWCDDWKGRMVNAIIADDSRGIVQEWARLRRLDYRQFAGSWDGDGEELLGAVAVSRNPKTCQTIAKFISDGIQCIAIDTAELDVIVLSEDNFEAWSGASIQSLLMTEFGSDTTALKRAHINNAAESLFSLESAKMGTHDIETPAAEERDGDRCTLTRSQVVKAG